MIAGATTRIILLMIAITDIIVMLLEFFLHYVPTYWKWFNVFYVSTCGPSAVVQTAVLTSAAWYITLMTFERAVAVCFPMKVSTCELTRSNLPFC